MSSRGSKGYKQQQRCGGGGVVVRCGGYSTKVSAHVVGQVKTSSSGGLGRLAAASLPSRALRGHRHNRFCIAKALDDDAGNSSGASFGDDDDDFGLGLYGANLLADAQVANRMTMDEYLAIKAPEVTRTATTVEAVSASWTEMDLVRQLDTPGGGSYGVFVIDPLNRGEALTLAQMLKLAMQDANGVCISSFAVPSLDDDMLLADASVLPGTDVTVLQMRSKLANLRFVDEVEPPTTWAEETGQEERPQPEDAVQEFTIEGPKTLFGGDVPTPAGIVCVQPDTHVVHVREGWSLTLRFTFMRGMGMQVLHSEDRSVLPSQKDLVERNFVQVPEVLEVSRDTEVLLERNFTPVERVKYKITGTSPEHGRVSDWTGRATMLLQSERLTFEVWSDVRCDAGNLMARAVDKATFWWEGMLKGAENMKGWDEKLAEALQAHEPNLRDAARLDAEREAEHMRDYDAAMRGFDDYADWRALEDGAERRQQDEHWRGVEAEELSSLGVEAYRRYRWWWQPPTTPEVADLMSPPAGVTTRASGGGGPETLGAHRVVRVAQPGEPDDLHDGMWCTVNACEDLADRDFYAKLVAWLEERNGRRWASRMARESLEHLDSAGVASLGSLPPYDANDDAELQAHLAGHYDPQLVVCFVNSQGIARQLYANGMLDASEVPHDEEVRALLFDRPLPGDAPGGEEDCRQTVYDEVLFGKNAVAYAGLESVPGRRGPPPADAGGPVVDAALYGDAMAPSRRSSVARSSQTSSSATIEREEDQFMIDYDDSSLASSETAAAAVVAAEEEKEQEVKAEKKKTVKKKVATADSAASSKKKTSTKKKAAAPKGDPVDGSTKVTELKLGARVENSLRQSGISTLSDLCSRRKDDLLTLNGIGPKSLDKIISMVEDLGWSIDQ